MANTIAAFFARMMRKPAARPLAAGLLGSLIVLLVWTGPPAIDSRHVGEQAPRQPSNGDTVITQVAGVSLPIEAIAAADNDAAAGAVDAPRFVAVDDPASAWSLPLLGQSGATPAMAYQPENPAFAPLRPSDSNRLPTAGPSTPAGYRSPGSAQQPMYGTSPMHPVGGGSPGLAGAPTPRAPAGPAPAPTQQAPSVVTTPYAPPAHSAPATDVPLPATTVAAAPIPAIAASVPDGPAQGPASADLPGELTGPTLASAGDPADDWFSPGHSPGIAEVDEDFLLDGRTLLFEILGTTAGDEYDQLIVDGKAVLDAGNVVFAFINGYVPLNPADLFELILADAIEVLGTVNFYYGFFDPQQGDPSWDLHAPKDLGLYSVLDAGSGIAMAVTNDSEGGRLSIQYDAKQVDGDPEPGPRQAIAPLAIPVPVPAPLLLLAAGLLVAAATLRRSDTRI